MTAKERCRDCAYLIERDNGKWVCSDYDVEIEKVSDDECWGDAPIMGFIEHKCQWD